MIAEKYEGSQMDGLIQNAPKSKMCKNGILYFLFSSLSGGCEPYMHILSAPCRV